MKFLKQNKKAKIFCIGFGKTGTTSIERALKDFGFVLGDQPRAELLIDDWSRRDFDPIIKFCKSAEAFQDVPFCLPYTYIALDQAFPGSKFILTVRGNSKEWYDSLCKFHSAFHGGGNLPTKTDLQKDTYRYEGYSWDVRKALWDVPDDDIYNQEILRASYENHVSSVIEYFRHRPDDLLVINVAETGSYKSFCDFLDVNPLYEEFPWENKTSDINPKKNN